MIRILIVDDHDLVRHGLERIFERTQGIEIVGEMSNGRDALQWLRNNECEVALLDISMPGISGIEVLKQVHEEKPNLPILILSNYPEDQYAVRLIKAGASGYLTKGCATAVIVKAVREVASGKKFFSPTVLDILVNEISMPAGKHPHEILSDREFKIFCLLVAGRTVNEIAEQLFISNKTVSTHKANLMEKMNLHNVSDLVRYAIKHRLTD
ncbi:MAG: response regulator transcription factor [Gallionella sp.]